jgi:hypothetical protein
MLTSYVNSLADFGGRATSVIVGLLQLLMSYFHRQARRGPGRCGLRGALPGLSIFSDTFPSFVTIAQVVIVLGYRRSLAAQPGGLAGQRDALRPSLLPQE